METQEETATVLAINAACPIKFLQKKILKEADVYDQKKMISIELHWRNFQPNREINMK